MTVWVWIPPDDFFKSLHKNLSHVFALTHFALDELVRNKVLL